MKSHKIYSHRKLINTLVFAITTFLICSCSSETHTTIKEIEKLDNIMEKTQYTFDSILMNSEFEIEKIESMKIDSTSKFHTTINKTDEY